MRPRLGAALVLPLVLLAVGCGGDGDDSSDQSVTVAVKPATATLAPGAQQTFTATLTGTSDARVTWTASAGTITAAGVFTAPATDGTVTIRATSVANTARFSTATVTVATRSVTIAPSRALVPANASLQFSATVAGLSDARVTWTTDVGTITATGLFTAPSSGSRAVVTATSVADSSIKDSAIVTIVTPAP